MCSVVIAESRVPLPRKLLYASEYCERSSPQMLRHCLGRLTGESARSGQLYAKLLARFRDNLASFQRGFRGDFTDAVTVATFVTLSTRSADPPAGTEKYRTCVTVRSTAVVVNQTSFSFRSQITGMLGVSDAYAGDAAKIEPVRSGTAVEMLASFLNLPSIRYSGSMILS